MLWCSRQLLGFGAVRSYRGVLGKTVRVVFMFMFGEIKVMGHLSLGHLRVYLFWELGVFSSLGVFICRICGS